MRYGARRATSAHRHDARGDDRIWCDASLIRCEREAIRRLQRWLVTQHSQRMPAVGDATPRPCQAGAAGWLPASGVLYIDNASSRTKPRFVCAENHSWRTIDDARDMLGSQEGAVIMEGFYEQSYSAGQAESTTSVARPVFFSP